MSITWTLRSRCKPGLRKKTSRYSSFKGASACSGLKLPSSLETEPICRSRIATTTSSRSEKRRCYLSCHPRSMLSKLSRCHRKTPNLNKKPLIPRLSQSSKLNIRQATQSLIYRRLSKSRQKRKVAAKLKSKKAKKPSK